MIIDFNEINSPQGKKYDFCVCGSGPAGMTIALRLSEAGFNVALFEGGGKDFSSESNDLLNADSKGLEANVNSYRQRFLGGTSNHWLGRCRPFDKSDFTNIPPTGIPGWPITGEEIDPYLIEAAEILDLDTKKGFTSFHEPTIDKMFGADISSWSRPPTRFKEKYDRLLDESPNLFVYLNANVVDIELDNKHENVNSILVKNFRGYSTKFSGSQIILAMGGIETPRILLNCNAQLTEGIGNQSDYVGRCFMEHPKVVIGEYIKLDEKLEKGVDFEFYTSDQLVSSQSVGKGNFTFHVISKLYSYGRLGKIKDFFDGLACDLNIDEKIQFISNFKCPGTGRIWTQFEQFPSSDSRIYLSDEFDSLGLRKAVFDWKLTDYDYRSFRKSSIQLAKSFSESGFGKIKLEDYILDETMDIPTSPHAHHMGTTRMAREESHGVVDENCRVFGVENLHIAGGSIFSTVGGGNPTLPIVQFALRLVDHLKRIS